MTEEHFCYRYPTIVIKVEERKTRVHKSGAGDTTEFTEASLGWYVILSLGLALPVGGDKPDFKPGDHVRLTLEKSP